MGPGAMHGDPGAWARATSNAWGPWGLGQSNDHCNDTHAAPLLPCSNAAARPGSSQRAAEAAPPNTKRTGTACTTARGPAGAAGAARGPPALASAASSALAPWAASSARASRSARRLCLQSRAVQSSQLTWQVTQRGRVPAVQAAGVQPGVERNDAAGEGKGRGRCGPHLRRPSGCGPSATLSSASTKLSSGWAPVLAPAATCSTGVSTAL